MINKHLKKVRNVTRNARIHFNFNFHGVATLIIDVGVLLITVCAARCPLLLCAKSTRLHTDTQAKSSYR